MNIEENVYRLLAYYQVPYEKETHKPVATVIEAKQIKMNIDGLGCKNLFLKGKSGRFYLTVIKDDQRLNIKELENVLHETKIHFASKQELEENLGLEPGSVTPFGVLQDQKRSVLILFDQALQHQKILVHPNTNRCTISLLFEDLLSILAKENHPYQLYHPK